MKLIAKINLKTGGVRVSEGDEFDAPEKAAVDLIKAGYADKAAAGAPAKSKAADQRAAAELAEAKRQASDAVIAAEGAVSAAESDEQKSAAQVALAAAQKALADLG